MAIQQAKQFDSPTRDNADNIEVKNKKRQDAGVEMALPKVSCECGESKWKVVKRTGLVVANCAIEIQSFSSLGSSITPGQPGHERKISMSHSQVPVPRGPSLSSKILQYNSSISER